MSRQPEKPRRVKLNFSVPVIFLKEDDTFVAYTPALDLSTCGDTFEDAQRMFAEAVTIFLKGLLKMGTLEEVLLECGWQKVTRPRTRWIPPVIVGQSQQEVNIQIAV